MRSPHRVATAALATSAVLASGISAAGAANADSSSVLYVNNAVAACTDSGSGTSAAPFCTIQAAANAAVPGTTVEIEAGKYTGVTQISSVGTAAAPIVFQAVGGVVIAPATGQTTPALVFDGASYVTFEGSEGVGPKLSQRLLAVGVEVDGSSHVTLDSAEAEGYQGTAVHVAGSSSNVTLSRSEVASSRVAVQIDAGSTGDAVSTNYFTGVGTGVSVTGGTGTEITSNTFDTNPLMTGMVTLSSGATGTSVEDNVFGTVIGTYSSSASLIAVDATSTDGSVVDYNVLQPGQANLYSWAGVSYASSSAFHQATGQGAHDTTADAHLFGVTPDQAGTAEENSADSSAPGVLSTDMYGYGCAGNPLIPVTGSGTPAFCARGAFQPNYTVSTAATALPVTATSVSLTSTVSEVMTNSSLTVTKPVFSAVSYTIDWGDGRQQTVPASATASQTVTAHTYAKAGTYTITQKANAVLGSGATATAHFTTTGSGYTPFGPKRLLDTRHGIGAPAAKVPVGKYVNLKLAGVDSIPANVTAVAVNLTVTDTTANGFAALGSSAQTSNLNYVKGQTVANSAIVPVNPDGGIEVWNEGNAGGTADLIVDVTGYFVQAQGFGYTPLSPARILDTRHGTGAPSAKVAANTGLPVAIAGAGSIPSGVTAVAVHVTVVDTTGNGWIAAEPDGAGVPGTSILNYLKGQTLSNTVIVPVAADGKIELYNGGGSTSVDLLADVSGYFSADSTEAYVPVTAFRAFDSRKDGQLNPDTAEEEYLAEIPSGSTASDFPAGATMVVNLTMEQEEANGYLADYPHGTALPGTSAVNFLAGQTVADLSLVGSTGAYQAVDFYNRSTGYNGLIVDVLGYFAAS